MAILFSHADALLLEEARRQKSASAPMITLMAYDTIESKCISLP